MSKVENLKDQRPLVFDMKPYKIEKPDLLYDACNTQLTENKIANQDSYWVGWGLVCKPCYRESFEKAIGEGKEELIREIKKDEDLRKSYLFRPMEIHFEDE